MCEKKYYEWNLVKNDSCWQNVNVWHDLFKAISMHIADKNLQHCLKVNVASSLGIFRICSVLLRFCVTSWCNRGLTVFWSCDTIGKPNEITRKTILVITLQIWHKLNYGLEVVNYFLATLQWHWIITTIFFHNQILLQYKETWVMIVRCLRAKTRWSIKRVYEILICFFYQRQKHRYRLLWATIFTSNDVLQLQRAEGRLLHRHSSPRFSVWTRTWVLHCYPMSVTQFCTRGLVSKSNFKMRL